MPERAAADDWGMALGSFDRAQDLSRPAKIGLVFAGYVVAILAGWATGVLYDLRMAQMPYDTSGGMYAAGQGMAVLGVFLVIALVPTLLALWFLRRSEALWRTIAVGAIAFATIGLISIAVMWVARGDFRHPVLIAFDLIALAQLLGVPLWTAAFVLFAAIAPQGAAKRMMVTALRLELLCALCAAIHWFVLARP